MEVIYPRCAGLDVHKQTVVACVRIAGDGPPLQEVRTFDTTTSGLLALCRLARVLRRRTRRDGGHRRVLEAGVARARRPLRAGAGQRGAREERARAQDRRQRRDVAGRPAGARPDPRQLRAAHGRAGAAHADAHPQAVRARASLARAAHREAARGRQHQAQLGAQRHHRARAGARCCRRSSTARPTPSVWLSCIGRVKASRAELLEALRGRVSAHHRFMLKLHLGHIDALDQAIAAIEKEVGLGLEPFRQAAKLLSTMPGLERGQRQRRRGRDRHRHVALRHARPSAVLGLPVPTQRRERRQAPQHPAAPRRQVAQDHAGPGRLGRHQGQGQLPASAVPSHLRARRGAKKAIIAVAASMLTAAWHMLRDGTEWHDLGAAHFDRADATKTANRLDPQTSADRLPGHRRAGLIDETVSLQ